MQIQQEQIDATAKILNEFTEKTKVLEDFKNKLNSLLAELLKTESINPHQISCRLKDYDGLKGKIERKGDKYTCLNDITDIVGLRIITYFEDDVDLIAEIIKKEFKIDEPNSADKRKIESDRFGYRSLHYVVEMGNDRIKLSENRRFNGLKAEIQIRSVLQHAWAEIEHDLGYKSEIEIPHTARRNFYRIAALLETADIEFVNLKKSLKKYEKNVANKINAEPNKVLIDKASLVTFIFQNPLVKEIDKDIASKSFIGNELPISVTENYLKRLKHLNIETINDLTNLLTKHKDELIQYGKVLKYQKYLQIGISISYLTYLLIAKTDNKWQIFDFLNKVSPQQGDANLLFAEKIIEAYKEAQKSNS